DHFRTQKRLFLACRGLLAQVAPVRGDARVQLARCDVASVAAEYTGRRYRRQASRLVGVAEDELPCLDRRLAGIRAGDPRPLDRRLADPVLEAEGGAPRWQLVAVLAPDHLAPGELLAGTACTLDDSLQPRGVGRERRQRDVDIGASERRLPV